MSDESDIEVVYVEDKRPNRRPKNILEFIMSELSLISPEDEISPVVLKRVLAKYEVEATESQVEDMLTLAKEKGLNYVIEAARKT